MKLKRYFPKFLKIATISDPTESVNSVLHLEKNRTVYVEDAKLILLFKEVLDFEFEIRLPPDGAYGNLLPYGNWTGMIGMIQREDADIAIGDINVFTERLNVVDFTFPYHYTSETFITDKPEYSPSNPYSFLHPFSPLVWMAILTSAIVVVLIFHVITTRKEESRNMILTTYASLLGITTNFKFRKIRAKFLIFSWFIGAMFITQCYKAVLLSFLTFPSLVGITDISQLAKATESSTFKCSTFPGSYLPPVLLKSTDDSLKRVGECLSRTNAFTKNAEDFLRPRTYKKAFIGEVSFIKRFQKAYFISEDTFFNSLKAVAVQKSFCCKDVLDEVIHKATAVGLLHKFRKDSVFQAALGLTYSGIEQSNLNRKLSLSDLRGAFILLIFGCILSFTVFSAELVLDRTAKYFFKKASFAKEMHNTAAFKSGKISSCQ